MNHPFGGKIEYDFVKSLYAQNGYKFNEGKYAINLFGIRNKDLITVDAFNDLLGVAYQDQFLNNRCVVISGTTKPGLTYLKDKLVNPNGTGILIPGFYENAFALGIHNAGKPTAHKAFLQSGARVFRVWRDADMDGKFDFGGPIYDDVGGLNLHRSGINDTVNVGPYSAACQAAQDDKEHAMIYALGERYFEIYKKLLSYALFQEK